MQCRSARASSKFWSSAVAALGICWGSVAGAAVNVQAVTPYAMQTNNIIYYAGNNASTTSALTTPGIAPHAAGFMDPTFTFHDLSIDDGLDAAGAHAIYFNVNASTPVQSGKHLAIALVATLQGNISSATPAFVPIAYAQGGKCSGNTTQTCLAGDTPLSPTGHTVSAAYTTGTTVSVGFYPYDLCAYIKNTNSVNPAGCLTSLPTVTIPTTSRPTTGVIPDLTSTAPTATFQITVHVVNVATDDVGALNAAVAANTGVERQVVSATFDGDTGTVSCNPADIYFPGDGQISVDTNKFYAVPSSGGAPMTVILAVANNTGTADAGSGAFSGGQLVQQLPLSSGPKAFTGFTNSTSLTDANAYSVAFNAGDSAGVYTGSPCSAIYPVRTSSIEGFLKRSNCFIATAAFRSIDAAPVAMLREFRDQVLRQTGPGRAFVQWYYGWSPPAAEWLMRHSAFRYPVLLALAPLEAFAWTALHPLLFLVLAGSGLLLLAAAAGARLRGAGSLTVFFFLVILSGAAARADEPASKQPYIDQLRQHIQEQENAMPERTHESPDPYIQQQKQQIKPESEGSYIDSLKALEPQRYTPPEKGTGYLDSEKSRLGPPRDGGAIEAVRAGHSELKAKKEGEITGALAVTMGASQTRSITGVPGASERNFTDVYGTGFTPDITVAYEAQPWHSEWYGNIGIVASVGMSYNSGQGVFQFNLPNPTSTGGFFGQTSRTKFQFFQVPVMAGVNYRFNLFRYLRPYVQAGPTVVLYYEGRNDGVDGKRGNSRGVQYGGGVAIQLDWLSRSSSWDLYDTANVKQYYLTFDYTRLSTFSGDVDFQIYGLRAGLTFEF